MMVMITGFFLFMYALGIYAGYQNYASYKNEWNTTFDQAYGIGQLHTLSTQNASIPTSDVAKNDVVSTTPILEESSGITMGQKNALQSAQVYLDSMGFSRNGLIKQLEFEGYTSDYAAYAADNCGADWNEQAAIKAQTYLDSMSFSRDGLIKQLEFEGFTSDQAEYGVSSVGY